MVKSFFWKQCVKSNLEIERVSKNETESFSFFIKEIFSEKRENKYVLSLTIRVVCVIFKLIRKKRNSSE